jgi:uncharacterized protein YjbI with pentapeptide repeats
MKPISSSGSPSHDSPNSAPNPPATPNADDSGNAANRSNGRASMLSNRLAVEDDESDGSAIARLVSKDGLPSNQSVASLIILLAIAIMALSLLINSIWLGIAGAVVALVIALPILWIALVNLVADLSAGERKLTIALLGALIAGICILKFSRTGGRIFALYEGPNWDAIGASGEVIGALGQILIAILAVYVAWRQYVISKDLTIQQNLITQQQTIDSYFQGISELVLDAEGLLEDWPQERAIAEGRTAAILSSVDGSGKAKIIRFLSRSRLLSPLKRDRLLGRAILDGAGGYEEDRDYGVRVIDLGVMLAGTELAGTDLRWTDLSDANLIRANLHKADLVKTNLARTILCEADLSESDMMGTRLFYGNATTATPRSRSDVPDYRTGKHTGAVIENADFTDVKRLSEEQRIYCCSWGGSKTRATVPGGCEGIPNRLGR